DLPYNKTGLEESASDGYIDIGSERQVSLATQTVFVRYARRVLSEAGVENASEISVDWDPGYEQPRLHSLRIIRDGRVIDRMAAARFRVLQLESERSKHIYDGRLTAVHLLEDVRQGDIIEYSYSLVGFNPVFGTHYAATMDTRFGVPVYFLYYKVLVPAGRALQVRQLREPEQGRSFAEGGQTAYEWRFTDRAALQVERDLPDGYDPWPFIQVSTFATWGEVSAWAQSIFPRTAAPAVSALAARIRGQYSDPERQAVAAIRFVQDEVRYLGIEMGANSHKPHPPAQVLAQRFGDCKDKSYLLCTLLQALGFEAWPVLTPSGFRGSVAEWLPSPFAFDHCTVAARVGSRSLYIDPTINAQRGGLADIAYPDYRYGLLVRPGTEALTAIALQDPGRVAVREVLRVKGRTEPGRLEVETVYTGSYADEMRADFRTGSLPERLRKYEQYYAAYFDKVKADSIRHNDDEDHNRFTVREYYRIGKPWKKRGDRDDAVGIHPFMINSWIESPEAGERRMPFGLRYPARMTEDIEVQLPEAWEGEDFSEQYEAPGFRLATAARIEGDRAHYRYTYEATADRVEPADLEHYRAVLDRIDYHVAFDLTWGKSAPAHAVDKTFTPLTMDDMYPLLYVLIGIAVFVTWLLRRHRDR
ncbi:MAG: DUF3857 domain-containing protein, partial [Chitinophagaceae bacterium]